MLMRLLGMPLVGRRAPVKLTVSFFDGELIEAAATSNPGIYPIDLSVATGLGLYRKAACSGFDALNTLAAEGARQ